MNEQSQNNNRTEESNLQVALRELASGKNRTVTARIRELIDHIEDTLSAGVKRKDIHKALVENGFETLSFEVFEVLLYRLRKKRIQPKKQTNVPLNLRKPDSAIPVVGNPLSVLSGKSKPNEFNPIPHTRIEIDPD